MPDTEFVLREWEDRKDVFRIGNSEIEFVTIQDSDTDFPYDSWSYCLSISDIETALKKIQRILWRTK